MLYYGANQKDCFEIANIINKYIQENNITQCYDLMCGGANIIDKIECEEKYAFDSSPTLIGLHTNGLSSNIPTSSPSKETWDCAYKIFKELRQKKGYKKTLKDYQKDAGENNPLETIGAIEWYASFGHGGFSKGMNTNNRNFYQESRDNHLKQIITPNYQKIIFQTGDYRYVNVPKGALIICDLPDRTSYQFDLNFNLHSFITWANTKRKTNPIFVFAAELRDNPIKILSKGKLYFLYNL